MAKISYLKLESSSLSAFSPDTFIKYYKSIYLYYFQGVPTLITGNDVYE